MFRGSMHLCRGSSFGLLCCALVVCSFSTDGVEPFLPPLEESVVCELCSLSDLVLPLFGFGHWVELFLFLFLHVFLFIYW